MRVIAGEFRGRTLLAPKTDATRPITDRVKQSLFDVLSPYIEEAVVYDCFAGTGSMGLECLSRGAKHAIFFEMDRSASDMLKKNIALLKVADRSTIVATDLFKWFTGKPGAVPANLIFLDPPYRFLKERPDDLRALAAAYAERFLSPDGLVVFRHDAKDSLALPALHETDVREYGSMTVKLLRRPPTK